MESSVMSFLPLLFMLLIFTPPACMIAKKAGYSWALGLIFAIPAFGLVGMWFFAFSKWPILKRD